MKILLFAVCLAALALPVAAQEDKTDSSVKCASADVRAVYTTIDLEFKAYRLTEEEGTALYDRIVAACRAYERQMDYGLDKKYGEVGYNQPWKTREEIERLNKAKREFQSSVRELQEAAEKIDNAEARKTIVDRVKHIKLPALIP